MPLVCCSPFPMLLSMMSVGADCKLFGAAPVVGSNPTWDNDLCDLWIIALAKWENIYVKRPHATGYSRSVYVVLNRKRVFESR